MKFVKSHLWQLSLILVVCFVIAGFFYFETSTFLRIFVILLCLIGFLAIKRTPEIIILTILYFGLYDLYNIRYGLAVPLAAIILAVFVLTALLFDLWLKFCQIAKNLNKDLFWLYVVTVGLLAMEIFLTMSFWPVDPQIKSLVIVVIFYIICRVFYLYAHNVLNSKKAIVLILFSLLILGAVLVFNLFYGF